MGGRNVHIECLAPLLGEKGEQMGRTIPGEPLFDAALPGPMRSMCPAELSAVDFRPSSLHIMPPMPT